MGMITDWKDQVERVKAGQPYEPPPASTQQPQIMPLANTGESPRTPDSVFASPTPTLSLPAIADAGAVRNAAYPAGEAAPPSVSGAFSPRTPDGTAAAYARTLGAKGNTEVAPSGPINDYVNQVTAASKTGGLPAALGAGANSIIGGIAGEAVPAISNIAGAGANAFERGVADPVFRFLEALLGKQPGGLAPAAFTNPAAPAAAPVRTTLPPSPVGARNVPIAPAAATPQAPVGDVQARINDALAKLGATANEIGNAPASAPGQPGTVITRVAPDGTKSFIGAGDPGTPSAAAAPGTTTAPVASVQQPNQQIDILSAINNLLAEEAQRDANTPRYTGGVGRNFAMSAADAAAANAALDKNATERRGKILEFATGQGHVANSATTAASGAARTAAEIPEIGARTEELQAKTKGVVTQEAERQQVAKLEQALAVETDPAKQKKLQSQLYALKGKPQPKVQIVTEEKVDPATMMPIKTPYVVDENGNARPLIPQNTGPAGMVFIGRTPDGKKRVFQDAKGNKHVED